jgi:hypothetical protein
VGYRLRDPNSQDLPGASQNPNAEDNEDDL